jgi:predicted ATPase
LKQRSLLIILDNCEHVIEAAARVVENLAASCPKVAFLVTSRERLRIPGEQLWEVAPLSVPEATSPIGGERIAESEAVQLFLDRAALSRSSFGLTDANSKSIAEISRRLEGIPLALELAAAQVATMSTDEITQRLDNPFELLTSGHRTASHRHQTLLAAVQWSYDLLADEQRRIFDRLSVFRSFDMEAATSICSMSVHEREICISVTLGLVDKSLVLFEGGGRYRLLETSLPLLSRSLGEPEARGTRQLAEPNAAGNG